MTKALIVNPRSGRGRSLGPALAEKLRDDTAVLVRVLDQFEQLPHFVEEMARENVTDLFISSGDGTIQEILTLIAERGRFRQLPRIALLPHGTTNLTAADIGLKHRSLDAQIAFLRASTRSDLRPRPTIRCANPGDGKVRHGMFVGTGAVAVATRYCQTAFNDKGVGGQAAVARTLATALRKYLFSKPDPQDEARFDRPYDITVDANGRRYCEGPQLLQMSTTLDKLVLNTRPFWGGRTGPIRTTIFPYPVPSVARWMLPVMYGGEDRKGPPQSPSFCSESLEVSSKAIFVIDGEFFDPPTDGPLRLEAGPVFTFLCG
jgi:diacylglycerol kinase (ATP)